MSDDSKPGSNGPDKEFRLKKQADGLRRLSPETVAEAKEMLARVTVPEGDSSRAPGSLPKEEGDAVRDKHRHIKDTQQNDLIQRAGRFGAAQEQSGGAGQASNRLASKAAALRGQTQSQPPASQERAGEAKTGSAAVRQMAPAARAKLEALVKARKEGDAKRQEDGGRTVGNQSPKGKTPDGRAR